MVGYSRLVGQDEAGTLARLTALRREIIEPLIARHAGRLFKAMGDGFLVEFASAVQAVMAARAIQEANAGGDVPLRVGIHVGDVVVQSDDQYRRPHRGCGIQTVPARGYRFVAPVVAREAPPATVVSVEPPGERCEPALNSQPAARASPPRTRGTYPRWALLIALSLCLAIAAISLWPGKAERAKSPFDSVAVLPATTTWPMA